mmetsp:Transcript_12707/g.10864  ORF Transcript_12707/g.10864 Transcript_12707/m.10864 type:complete len:122 (+) Transcript_12707:114-479(+)
MQDILNNQYPSNETLSPYNDQGDATSVCDKKSVASSDNSSNKKKAQQGEPGKFVCPYPECGKIFQFKSVFERHATTHTKVRSHKCTYPGCDKAFKRADALNMHMKTHGDFIPEQPKMVQKQ